MEKQIFGDPEAADIVFTSGADVLAIGMNVTRQVIMKSKFFFFILCSSTLVIFGQFVTHHIHDSIYAYTYNMFVDNDLTNLAKSDGIFAKYLCKILDHYFSYHRDAYNIKGTYFLKHDVFFCKF